MAGTRGIRYIYFMSPSFHVMNNSWHARIIYTGFILNSEAAGGCSTYGPIAER